jgi:hypothetical protein
LKGSGNRRLAVVFGTFVGFLVIGILGIYGFSKIEDGRRLERLQACIDTQLPDFKASFHTVGLDLGEPEIWIEGDGVEEYATYPVLGDGPGAPKRFYRIHSGDKLCKAGLVDSDAH